MNQSIRNILKKITVKTCGAKPDIEKLIEYKKQHGATAVMPLLAVMGIASDFKAGQNETTGTPYVKLLGQFKAVNHDTGEMFISGACILPGAASDLIYGALAGLKVEGGSVEFALRIGVRFDDTAVTKYVYVVEQVYSPEKADPLTALEARVSEALRLAAPKAAPEPELAQASGAKKR